MRSDDSERSVVDVYCMETFSFTKRVRIGWSSRMALKCQEFFKFEWITSPLSCMNLTARDLKYYYFFNQKDPRGPE
jgi:hypothetical protein